MSTFFNSLLQKAVDKAKEALNDLVNEGSKQAKEWVTGLVKQAADQAVAWVSDTLKSAIDSLANQVKSSLLADPLAATTSQTLAEAPNTEVSKEEFFDCPPLDETSYKKLFGDVAAFPAEGEQASSIHKFNPTISIPTLAAPAA